MIERGGRFLLVEEPIDRRRVWNQPAGHLEARETVIDAIVREVREETGYRFEPSGWLGATTLALPSGAVSLRIAFTGTVGATPESDPEPPITAVGWLTRTEIDSLEVRSPLTTAAIDAFFVAPRLPLTALAHFDAQS